MRIFYGNRPWPTNGQRKFVQPGGTAVVVTSGGGWGRGGRFGGGGRRPRPGFAPSPRPAPRPAPAPRGCPPGAHHEAHDPSRPGWTCGGKVWNPEIIAHPTKPGYNLTGRAVIAPGCRRVGKTEMTYLTDNECWTVTRKVDASNYEVCPPPPGTECVFEDEGMSGLGDTGAPREYARAFAAAFVADVERAPTLKRALARGEIGKRGLTSIALRDLDAAARGSDQPALFPNVRKFVRETLRQDVRRERLAAGVGQWAELATSLLNTAAGVTAKVYSTKLQSDAAESIAKLEIQRQQAAVRAAELQAQAARLQYAQAEAAATAQGGSAGAGIGSVPWWAWVLGIAVLGVGGYLVLGRK